MKPELNFVVEKLENRLEMQVIVAPVSTNACASACSASQLATTSCALQPMMFR